MNLNTIMPTTKMLKCFTATMVLFLITIPIGCDDESSSDRVSPNEAITKAVKAMDSLDAYRDKSFTVQLNHEQSDWALIPSDDWENVTDYEYSAPDRHHFVTVGEDIWSESVIIGDQKWWRGKTSHLSHLAWGIAGEEGRPNVEVLNEFQSFIQCDDMQLLGSEVIEGTDCYIIRLTKEVKEIPDLEEITADIWAGKKDYLIRQVISITPIPYSEPEYFQCLVKHYYDFNEPINIEPPLQSEFMANNE